MIQIACFEFALFLKTKMFKQFETDAYKGSSSKAIDRDADKN